MGWGGKREGAGRLPAEEKRRRVTVLLSETERARLKELGGVRWLRKQLANTNNEETKMTRLQALLDAGRLWEKGGLSRVYLDGAAAAEYLEIRVDFNSYTPSQTIEPIDCRRLPRTVTPSGARELLRALESSYYDNKARKFVVPGGWAHGWIGSWLAERFEDAQRRDEEQETPAK